MLVSWKPPDPAQAAGGGKAGLLSFVDPMTFKVLGVGLIVARGEYIGLIRYAASGGDFRVTPQYSAGMTYLRASYDGSLFGICQLAQQQAAAEVALKADAGSVTVSHYGVISYLASRPAYMLPAPDGEHVFGGKSGIRDAIFLGTPSRDPTALRLSEPTPQQFPTTDGRFGISVRTGDMITLFRVADYAKVMVVTGLDEMTGILQRDSIVRDGISLENRYHFVPAAKLLVTIPQSNDRLVLRRLEMPATAKHAAATPKQ